MSQLHLEHDTAPAPISDIDFLRESYEEHLAFWLQAQSLLWQPSMLASKLGHDIELQIVRKGPPFPDNANLMRTVTALHARIVYYKRSTTKKSHQVWKDVLPFANPYFVVIWPRFGELLDRSEREVVYNDDFLKEFDLFVEKTALNSKVVVLMKCPGCERWDKQDFHQGYKLE
ncbi:hypothetical protein HDV57DRAFT_522590 [Trichoderma longibrachiatum]